MLHHLNLACGGSLGFYDPPDESYLTARKLFRWILVDWFRNSQGFTASDGLQNPAFAEIRVCA